MAGAAVMAAAVVGLAATVWWSSRGGPAPETAGGAERIDGRISLAPGSGPTPEGAMVVVYAYAIEGSQVPLAVLRRPATALPLDFRLDDSLAPSSEHRLSGVRQLVIGARLGAGGEALSQVGDWLAGSQKVAPGAQGVQLVLQPPPK
jgi:cytochrome c-type biogenesis protein CcmH